MYRNGLISIVMLTAVSTGAAGQTAAAETMGQDMTAPFMQMYGETLPPVGHIGFCQRHPEDCMPDWTPKPASLSPLGDRGVRELEAVNRLVNEMVLPVTDQELYGELEHWDYPAGQGDCEDYVLLKRRILIERGWSQSALLITVVRDENGDGHAVLSVRTDHGDVILDNKIAAVVPWSATPYSYIKRQSEFDPRVWISLAPPNDYRAARTSGTRSRQEH